MIALQRLHIAIAIMAGLALAADLFGARGLAIALLVVITCGQVASLEILRAIAAANREPKP